MKTNHNFYSNIAFNLAEEHLGQTNLNPSVGCVVVKNHSVISSGITSKNGRPHAEYNALNKAQDFSNSSMYVTLEPCSHYGVTPPCTEIIKRKKIKKVFYCFNDPDKRSFNKAKKNLRRKNIKVFKVNIARQDFYKSYYINKIKNLPLIDAKIAFSKDFYTINRKKKWITNFKSRRVSHLLRSKYDSILSTSKSINKDNSLLNCRINGLDNHKPDLIIIDMKLKLRKNLKIFNLSPKRKIYIITSSKKKEKINFFKKKCKIFILNKLNDKKDFNFLFNKLFKIGKRRILIESGLIFLNQLLKLKLIDYLYVFKSDKNLNENGSNNSKLNYIKKFKFGKNLQVNLITDRLYKIRIKK